MRITRCTSALFEWFGVHARGGWASCPISQNGYLRIMSHPGYPNALPVAAVMERLAPATRSSYHQFWPDDVSLLDPSIADPGRIHGPRQLTDVFLLALAIHHGGCFVTFDTTVPWRWARRSSNGKVATRRLYLKASERQS